MSELTRGLIRGELPGGTALNGMPEGRSYRYRRSARPHTPAWRTARLAALIARRNAAIAAARQRREHVED